MLARPVPCFFYEGMMYNLGVFGTVDLVIFHRLYVPCVVEVYYFVCVYSFQVFMYET
jgi:hypothetical protein